MEATISLNMARLKMAVVETSVALALFVGVVSVSHCGTGCKQVEAVVPSSKETEYTAEIAKCAGTEATLAESKECRRQVNARYGLCETDGGWPTLPPCKDGGQ